MASSRLSLMVSIALATSCAAPQVSENKTTVAKATGDAVVIHGEVTDSGISLTVGGKRIIVPEASLALRVPRHLQVEGANKVATLKPPGESGYSGAKPTWELQVVLPPPAKVAAWQLTVFEVGTDGSPKPFFGRKGTGQPGPLVWNGLGVDGSSLKAGKLYVAQLIAVGNEREAEAASRFVPFFVAGASVAAKPMAPEKRVLRGALFDGPLVTLRLRAQVRALAKGLVPGSKVNVLVHSDGSDTGFASRVQTQRQAVAVRKLLVAAGVPEGDITAKGRGSSEPLAPADSPANRDKNRRVVVTVTPPKGATAPAPVASASVDLSQVPTTLEDVRIDGREVVLKDGVFEHKRFLSDRAGFLVHVELRDGRLATVRTHRTLDEARTPVESPSGKIPPSSQVASTGVR